MRNVLRTTYYYYSICRVCSSTCRVQPADWRLRLPMLIVCRLPLEDLKDKMSEAVDRFETPAMPLGSFPAIFSQAVSMGTLSRRRAYHEALQSMADTIPIFRLIGRPFARYTHTSLLVLTHACEQWLCQRAEHKFSWACSNMSG